jgi:hypothetical protein
MLRLVLHRQTPHYKEMHLLSKVEMSISQITLIFFALTSLIVTIWAIVDIVRSPVLRYKWLWVFGSLFSFFGMSTSIANPGDLFFWVGFNIPGIRVAGMANGDILLTAGVPVIALIVLAKTRYYSRGSSSAKDFE